MPVLKNPRHELYAQALAEGKTASEAIGLAGYSPDPRNTTPLTKNPEIARRVQELLQMKAARSQRKAEYSTQWVIEMLMLNAQEAREEKDYSASNAALRLLGMEKRMFVDKVEAGNVGDFDHLDNISDVLEKVAEDIGPEAALALSKAFGLTDKDDNTELQEAIPPTDAVN